MKKRIIITLGMVLALCLAFTTVVMATQATKNSDITYRSIKIVVNGTEIAPVDVNGDSTEPFILNSEGSTYLPVRAIGDALGLTVDWDNDTSTVILKSDGTEKFSSKKPSATNATKKATLTYRDISITLDGSKVKLVNANGDAVEPFIYNNSTYLPVRAVATALGCTITWDNDTSTVTITKQKATDPSTPSGVAELAIKTQPKAAAINVGATGSVSIEVSGGTAPYTFEWQYDGGTYWGNGAKWYTQKSTDIGIVITSSGSKSTVAVTPNTANYYLYSYPLRCIVTDAKGNTVTSDQIQITNPAPTITTQPKSQSLKIGETGSISIEVSGGTAPYTFQWQYDNGTYTKGTAYWNNITQGNGVAITSSGSKSTLSDTPGSADHYLYFCPVRCIVTDSKGNSVTSDQVNISQVTTALTITKQPYSTTIDAGRGGTLSMQVSGGTTPYTFAWQYKTTDSKGSSKWNTLSGSESGIKIVNYSAVGESVLSIDPDSTKYFLYSYPIRCVVTDSKGNTLTSKEVTITYSGK